MYISFTGIFCCYFILGNILEIYNSNLVKNKFKYASYYLTIAHQGLVLPLLYFPNLIYCNSNISKVLLQSTISYFITDFYINRNVILKDYKFILHHFITVFLIWSNLSMYKKSYLANCTTILELGSLWLSVTDLYPNNLNYKMRFHLYLLSRLFALKSISEYIFDYTNNINIYIKTAGVSILYIHNILIGYYLYKGMRKSRNG